MQVRGGDWLCVDVAGGRGAGPAGSAAAAGAAAGATRPLLFAVACYPGPGGHLRDVTRRYADPAEYLTRTRRARAPLEGLARETLAAFAPPPGEEEAAEDAALKKRIESAPMPTTVSAFKVGRKKNP